MSALPAFSFQFSSSPLRVVHSVYNTNDQRLHAFNGNEEEDWSERKYRKHYSTLFPVEITVQQGETPSSPSGSSERTTAFYLGGDTATLKLYLWG